MASHRHSSFPKEKRIRKLGEWSGAAWTARGRDADGALLEMDGQNSEGNGHDIRRWRGLCNQEERNKKGSFAVWPRVADANQLGEMREEGGDDDHDDEGRG